MAYEYAVEHFLLLQGTQNLTFPDYILKDGVRLIFGHFLSII